MCVRALKRCGGGANGVLQIVCFFFLVGATALHKLARQKSVQFGGETPSLWDGMFTTRVHGFPFNDTKSMNIIGRLEVRLFMLN